MTRLRRSNVDIIANILKVAKNGAKKTHIVYKANLNFKILKEYLDELVELNLISTDLDGNIKTTDKGIQYLNYYFGFKEFMDSPIFLQ